MGGVVWCGRVPLSSHPGAEARPNASRTLFGSQHSFSRAWFNPVSMANTTGFTIAAMTVEELPESDGNGQIIRFHERDDFLPEACRWPEPVYRDFDDEVLLSPIIAGAALSRCSDSVIGNALRLRKVKL